MIPGPPKGSECVESLEIAEIVGFGSIDGILGAALEIIDAKGDEVELIGKHLGIGGADALDAAPIVEGEEQTGVGLDIGTFVMWEVYQNLEETRAGSVGPFLSREKDGCVGLWE